MFLPLQFSTLNTSQHAPFLYVSITPYPAVVSQYFVAIKQKHYCRQFCIQREPKSLCSWTTVALHCADSLLVQQMKPPDTDREYGNIRSLMIGLMERKLSEMWNIIIVRAFECPCVSVCSVYLLEYYCVCISRLNIWTKLQISTNPFLSIMMILGTVRHYVCCL